MTKDLPRKFIDITTATVIAGPTIGIIGGSNLPTPIKSGASALVGVGLVKGTARLFK